jgi:hypothetical protein
MKIIYALFDKNGELLVCLKGKEYIAPISSNVIFYDQKEDLKTDDFVAIAFVSKVTYHMYSVSNDVLHVNCELVDDLTEKDKSDLLKYNQL